MTHEGGDKVLDKKEDKEHTFKDYLERVFKLIERVIEGAVDVATSIAREVDFGALCLSVCSITIVCFLLTTMRGCHGRSYDHDEAMATKGLVEVPSYYKNSNGTISSNNVWVDKADAVDVIKGKIVANGDATPVVPKCGTADTCEGHNHGK